MKGLVSSLAIVTLLVGLLAMQACKDLDCGPGTVQEGSQCVSVPLVKCGVGTELKFGECVALDVIVVVQDTNAPPQDTNVNDVGPELCPEATATTFCVSGSLYNWKGYTLLGSKIDGVRIRIGDLFRLNAPDGSCSGAAAPESCFNGPKAEIKDDGTFVLKDLEFRSTDTTLILTFTDENETTPVYQTTVALVVGFDQVPGKNYSGMKVFPVKIADVVAWEGKLGLGDFHSAPPTSLKGALFAVFGDKNGVPLEGMQLFKAGQRVNAFFFNDAMDDFVEDDGTKPDADAPATGKSGSLLAIGASIAAGYGPKPKPGTSIDGSFLQTFGGSAPGVLVTAWWNLQ